MAIQYVLINGAGLAVLSLAIALPKRNIRSTLFEFRAMPTTIDGTIVLAPNALRVLDQTMGIYSGCKYYSCDFDKDNTFPFFMVLKTLIMNR
jgi:hypothetical protein